MQEWKIVCFGDSLTYGYGVLDHVAYPAQLAQLLPQERPESKWTIVNRGVNGDTSGDALRRLERDVLQQKPQIVVILLGSNDSALNEGQYCTPWQYEQNLSQILERLLALRQGRAEFHGGTCLPLLITPPPVVDTDFYPFTTTDRIEWYREVVLRLAEKYGCPVFDLFSVFLAEQKKGMAAYEDLFQFDGLHWSNQGYARFTPLIAQKIMELTDGV